MSYPSEGGTRDGVTRFSGHGRMPQNHGFLDSNRGAAEARWRRQQAEKREKMWAGQFDTPEHQPQQSQEPTEQERQAAWNTYYAAQASQAALVATDPAEAERQRAWAAYYTAQASSSSEGSSSAAGGSSADVGGKRGREDGDPRGGKAARLVGALLEAVEEGPAAVKEALRAGANVDAAGPDGKTALLLAASTNRHSVMQVLLDADADPDHVADDDEGFGAIHHACLQGNKKMVELLLAAGANPVLKTKAGDAPIMLIGPKDKSLRVIIGNAAGKRHAH
tara:strand:+ start:147 stop:983 length:837 start_codon:yes stop_codon:yes gene_type:complete